MIEVLRFSSVDCLEKYFLSYIFCSMFMFILCLRSRQSFCYQSSPYFNMLSFH